MNAQTLQNIHPMQSLREAEGLHQSDLARLLGIAQTTVSAYERWAKLPRPKVANSFISFARARGHTYTLADLYPSDIDQAKASTRQSAA